MPEDLDSTPYDFLTVVGWWNLYGLPVVLAAVVVAVVVLARRHGRGVMASDGIMAVRRVGLIHYALAVRAAILLAQELLTLRTMGIPQSPIILIGSAIAVIINPLLGLAMRRRPPRQRARRSAIAWYTLLVLIATYTAYWMWKYRAFADPARWPEHTVSLVIPWFLWILMFVPRVRREFAERTVVESKRSADSFDPANPNQPPLSAGWGWVSMVTLLFLLIVCSTVVVEAVDWAHRMVTEPGEIP